MAQHLPDWMEDFLARRAAEAASARTLLGYRNRLAPLARFLARRGCLRAVEVAPADLDAYLAEKLAHGLGWRSLRHIVSTLRSLFRDCQERGLVLANPARDLPVITRDEDALLGAPLSEEQVACLFAGLARDNPVALRNRAHLELLYGCALRLAESLALDLTDLDLERRTLHVRHGKGDVARSLPLPGGALGAVQDYLAVRRDLLCGPDHGALLLSRTGIRLPERAVRTWFQNLNRDRPVGMPHLRPHLFRHSIAVHLLRGGADIRHVQGFLGHASMETTRHYLRLVSGHLREDYDRAMPVIAVDWAAAPLGEHLWTGGPKPNTGKAPSDTPVQEDGHYPSDHGR
jgi:integrase/recombinase XerD